MGQLQINPVLEVISSAQTLQKEKKYPPGLLQFNQTGWRAYYHCHSYQDDIQPLFATEHGHFHIFIQINKDTDSWTHLVALSIDEYGQPIRWFMVNHWVTAENWLAEPELTRLLSAYFSANQNLILEQDDNKQHQLQYNHTQQWLLSMLELYQQEILILLKMRDRSLMLENHKIENIGQDKHYYLLSEAKIDLQAKLESILMDKN